MAALPSMRNPDDVLENDRGQRRISGVTVANANNLITVTS